MREEVTIYVQLWPTDGSGETQVSTCGDDLVIGDCAFLCPLDAADKLIEAIRRLQQIRKENEETTND